MSKEKLKKLADVCEDELICGKVLLGGVICSVILGIKLYYLYKLSVDVDIKKRELIDQVDQQIEIVDNVLEKVSQLQDSLKCSDHI